MPGLAAARLASQEKSLQADEQQREDVQAERTTWRAEQPAWPVEELIFLDESGIDTAMTRRYARAQGGRRAIGRAPAGHWRRLTLLGALGREGLVAMMTVPRATDTEVFLAFVEQVLLPALKNRRKPVVILDRLGAHRSPRILAVFAAAGVEVRFLPPPAFAGAGSIRPISIPSSRAGRKSRPPCVPPPPAPWMPSMIPCRLSSTPSPNATPRDGSDIAATQQRSADLHTQKKTALAACPADL